MLTHFDQLTNNTESDIAITLAANEALKESISNKKPSAIVKILTGHSANFTKLEDDIPNYIQIIEKESIKELVNQFSASGYLSQPETGPVDIQIAQLTIHLNAFLSVALNYDRLKYNERTILETTSIVYRDYKKYWQKEMAMHFIIEAESGKLTHNDDIVWSKFYSPDVRSLIQDYQLNQAANKQPLVDSGEAYPAKRARI